MEQRARSAAAQMTDGAGMTPTHIPAFDADPKTTVGAVEKALPIAEAQALFGAPNSAHGTATPSDSQKPVDFHTKALNTAPFFYLNTATGVTWIYDPTNSIWHAEHYQYLVVPGNNIREFSSGVVPTGFTHSHIFSVQLEQLAGTEELSINRWDRMVPNTLRVKFRGQQIAAGNHRLIVYYKK